MAEHHHMETCKNKLACPKGHSCNFKQVQYQLVQPSLNYQHNNKRMQIDRQLFNFVTYSENVWQGKSLVNLVNEYNFTKQHHPNVICMRNTILDSLPICQILFCQNIYKPILPNIPPNIIAIRYRYYTSGFLIIKFFLYCKKFFMKKCDFCVIYEIHKCIYHTHSYS